MPSQQSDTGDERRVSKAITMFKIIMSLMSIMLLIMAICFLICLLQTDPGNQSEHGGHASPALFDTPITSRVIYSDLKLRARVKREVSGEKDECLSTYGGLELDYVIGSTTSFTFDLCDVVNCRDAGSAWRGYNVWLCWDYSVSTHCERGNRPYDSWCRNWDQVRGYTGQNWEPLELGSENELKLQRDFSPSGNALTLSLGNRHRKQSMYLVLGVETSGGSKRI